MINRLLFVGKFNGPNNRLNRDRFPHLYVRTVMVPGNVRWFGVVSFFENIEECLHYVNQLEDIKNVINALNQDQTEGKISAVMYASKLEYEWMPMIDHFVAEWGKDMVPQDVRHSSTHVRRTVDIPPFEWPVNVDVPSDVVAEVSLFTPQPNDELEIVSLETNDESSP